MDRRDERMLDNSVEHLKSLDRLASATIVVGDKHAGPLVDGLQNKFSDRAIVYAKQRRKRPSRSF